MLAALLVFATSTVGAYAVAMTQADHATVAEIGTAPDDGACKGCGSAPGGKAMNCASACMAPSAAVLPSGIILVRAQRSAPMARALPMPMDRTASPDPYPPKTSNHR